MSPSHETKLDAPYAHTVVTKLFSACSSKPCSPALSQRKTIKSPSKTCARSFGCSLVDELQAQRPQKA